MRCLKVKLIFLFFSILLTFFLVSLTVSLRYLDVQEDSNSLDVSDFLNGIPESSEKFNVKTLHHKLKRVQSLNLKKLEKTKHCRFQCKHAIDYHNSGVHMSLAKSEPKVRIMMFHCMHCLKSKGLLGKIRERRRRKRALLEEMRITANIKPTLPIGKAPSSKLSNTYQHKLFGGWVSDVIQTRKKKEKSKENVETFRSRNLLNIPKKNKQVAKTKILVTPKNPIVIKQEDDDVDYVNNYEDNFDRDVPDLEKQAKKTQDSLTYFLVGSFAFFALLFMFVFPVVSFFKMCLKNYHSNALIVVDVLRCRDPKYRLVKEMCEKCGIAIPDYHQYKELMSKYEAKHAETVAKERLKKEFVLEESEDEL